MVKDLDSIEGIHMRLVEKNCAIWTWDEEK
jgi:hypothetical protein